MIHSTVLSCKVPERWLDIRFIVEIRLIVCCLPVGFQALILPTVRNAAQAVLMVRRHMVICALNL